MFSSDQAPNSGREKSKGKATGSAYETVADWRQIGTFVAGLGIGAVVGAAIALLAAPGSGEETRGRIRRKLSREGDESLWESLGHELKKAAARRLPVEDEEIEELEEMNLLSDVD